MPIDWPAPILAVQRQKRHCRVFRCQPIGLAVEIDHNILP